MKKRVFALLLIAAMSFSLLAACGSKTEQPETPDTNKPEVSTPVESFSWFTPEEIEQQAALPTAFRQFWEDNIHV